jgi:hypothetical protein
VEPSDLLNAKAREYELLAASHTERAPLGATREHLASASAFTVIAIALREVAQSLEEAA